MKEIRISILGDICTDWGFRDRFDKGDTASIFGDVLDELKTANFTVANLELPLSDLGGPIDKTGPCLHGKPDDFKVLKEAGIDAVSLANNHILDFGIDALTDTLKNAKNNGIETFGADQNKLDAAKPFYREIDGYKIGFLSFCEAEFSYATDERGGANLFDPYISLNQIANAKKECDYLIVLYHGGIEHYRLPSPLLQKKCRTMVDFGADLVLCQHSHCIGSYEKYVGKTILYGQGNAIFGKKNVLDWNLGLLVNVTLSQEEAKVEYRVFEAGDTGISFVSLNTEQERLNEMRDDSANLDDVEFVAAKWKDFCDKQKSAYLPSLLGWNRIFNKLNRKFNNKLAKVFLSKKKYKTTLNLIRCDAHREVLLTFLEEEMQK